MFETYLASTGQLDPARFDFQDYTHPANPHESFDDIVEQKIFKYKYRQNADDMDTFDRREQRVYNRFMDRAENRDPALEQQVIDILKADHRDSSMAHMFGAPEKFKNVLQEETRPFREYMATEAV